MEHGLEILHLSSHRGVEDIEADEAVSRKHGIPDGQVFFRQNGEQYKDVAERVLPHVLIEDDCESIGREEEMAYPHIRQELKVKIKSIVVKEFGGIDRLPDEVAELVRY